MKKTAVLSAVALAIGLGSATSGFAADNRIGVTIYKYDDNFMSLMRKEIDKEAKALGGIELLMTLKMHNLFKMTKWMVCFLKV